MTKLNLHYPDLFTALGKFIAEKKIEDVCVMEFEDGIIIMGSVVYEAKGSFRRAQETFILSASDLEKMGGIKHGLFGR